MPAHLSRPRAPPRAPRCHENAPVHMQKPDNAAPQMTLQLHRRARCTSESERGESTGSSCTYITRFDVAGPGPVPARPTCADLTLRTTVTPLPLRLLAAAAGPRVASTGTAVARMTAAERLVALSCTTATTRTRRDTIHQAARPHSRVGAHRGGAHRSEVEARTTAPQERPGSGCPHRVWYTVRRQPQRFGPDMAVQGGHGPG